MMQSVEIGNRIQSLQQLKMARISGASILPCDLPDDTVWRGSTECKDKGIGPNPCNYATIKEKGMMITPDGLSCPRQKGDIVAIPMEPNTPVQLVAETA